MNKDERNYLDLLSDIICNGSERNDRTGVGTIGIFGTQLRFSLERDKIPMLTTKKMFAKGVIEELLFFLRGDTDTKKLEAKGVNIWKGNTTREFLNKRGLHHLSEGDMGKGYGFQWRKFGADQIWSESGDEVIIDGVDQLLQVINTLKTNPNDRRIIMSAWNPQQLKDMALPPCHILAQFYALNGELSCQFYQRSVDSFLGLPFNILSYAILTRIVAQTTGLKPKEVIFVGGDTHIYKNHIMQVEEQIRRSEFEFPTLTISKKLETIADIESLEFSDFVIKNYKCHPAIKAEMAI
jgi:thymidylate synthase